MELSSLSGFLCSTLCQWELDIMLHCIEVVYSFSFYCYETFHLWIYQNLLIQLPVNVHWDFSFWPLWMKLLWIFLYIYFCGHKQSFLSNSKISGSVARCIFIFSRYFQSLFLCLCHSCIPTSNIWVLIVPHPCWLLLCSIF